MTWFRWLRETAKWFRDGKAKSLLAGIENMKASAQGLGPDDPVSKAIESYWWEARRLARLQDLWDGVMVNGPSDGRSQGR
jgi:hypothetical protein